MPNGEPWTDVLEIRTIIDRYANGIDRRDWESVRSCFTSDCRADYGRWGSWTEREPFLTWLDELHRDIGPTMHRMTNHDIRVDGDMATATSYLDAVLLVEHQGHDLLHVIGTYTDGFVRTTDGWQIRERRSDTVISQRGDRKRA